MSLVATAKTNTAGGPTYLFIDLYMSCRTHGVLASFPGPRGLGTRLMVCWTSASMHIHVQCHIGCVLPTISPLGGGERYWLAVSGTELGNVLEGVRGKI